MVPTERGIFPLAEGSRHMDPLSLAGAFLYRDTDKKTAGDELFSNYPRGVHGISRLCGFHARSGDDNGSSVCEGSRTRIHRDVWFSGDVSSNPRALVEDHEMPSVGARHHSLGSSL